MKDKGKTVTQGQPPSPCRLFKLTVSGSMWIHVVPAGSSEAPGLLVDNSSSGDQLRETWLSGLSPASWLDTTCDWTSDSRNNMFSGGYLLWKHQCWVCYILFPPIHLLLDTQTSLCCCTSRWIVFYFSPSLSSLLSWLWLIAEGFQANWNHEAGWMLMEPPLL